MIPQVISLLAHADMGHMAHVMSNHETKYEYQGKVYRYNHLHDTPFHAPFNRELDIARVTQALNQGSNMVVRVEKTKYWMT